MDTADKFLGNLRNNLYNTVMKHGRIFSLMYSPHLSNQMGIEEQIIRIFTSDLKWTYDKSQFMYVFGWPGPDFNVYTAETYGKGWAFTKQEIIKAWGEND